MFNNLTVRTRLFCLISLMSLFVISLSFGGLYGMKKANDGLQTVYLDRTVPLATLSEIQEKVLHNRTAMVTVFSFPESMTEQHKKIEQNMVKITKLLDLYMATYLTPEETILTNKLIADRKLFAEALKTCLELQRAGSEKKEEAQKFYQKFRKAPSLQVGDVRNIGVAPL